MGHSAKIQTLKYSIEKLQGQNTLKTSHNKCSLVKLFVGEGEITITCFSRECTMNSCCNKQLPTLAQKNRGDFCNRENMRNNDLCNVTMQF